MIIKVECLLNQWQLINYHYYACRLVCPSVAIGITLIHELTSRARGTKIRVLL